MQHQITNLTEKCAGCAHRRVTNHGRFWYCAEAIDDKPKRHMLHCQQSRSRAMWCGPSARLFEAKPVLAHSI